MLSSTIEETGSLALVLRKVVLMLAEVSEGWGFKKPVEEQGGLSQIESRMFLSGQTRGRKHLQFWKSPVSWRTRQIALSDVTQ